MSYPSQASHTRKGIFLFFINNYTFCYILSHESTSAFHDHTVVYKYKPIQPQRRLTWSNSHKHKIHLWDCKWVQFAWAQLKFSEESIYCGRQWPSINSSNFAQWKSIFLSVNILMNIISHWNFELWCKLSLTQVTDK